VAGLTRRQLLAGAAVATTGVAVLGGRAEAKKREPPSTETIAGLFDGLPGDFAFKVYAPATPRTRQLDISMGADRQLFVASAIKAFVAVEALRQDDTPDVAAVIADRELTLDSSVWSFASPVFNPPNLAGTVSERTALDAMILHSDNTATDMVLKQVGPDHVRALLMSASFGSTRIPDSTRSFLGYLKGAPDYKTFMWEQLLATADEPYVNAPLNPVSTLASSASDLVSLYARALHGEFFKNAETLNQLRALFSIGDQIWVLPYPLGVTPFGKGGSFDVPGSHALCAPGAMVFDDVWVYFAFILNWPNKEPSDPTTFNAFITATGEALQLIKDSLAAPLSPGLSAATT
jgi:beta-lactamase class A